MERKTGFLVHLTMAYPLIMPFLRGIYLTMKYWRPKRDRGGYKFYKWVYDSFINSGKRQGHIGYSSGYKASDISPNMVKAVGKLFKHLSYLVELFKEDEPARKLILGAAVLEVFFIFGDASGSDFGLLRTEGISVGYQFGVWNEEGDGKSSNYKEFCNIVETLEEVGRKLNLQGREVFLYMYNMVSEIIAAAGSSKSEVLFNFVVQLHCLQMQCPFHSCGGHSDDYPRHKRAI